ncbi:MAG: T9SS type A sorting domain-containing protein [Cytophagaceae bacterium]
MRVNFTILQLFFLFSFIGYILSNNILYAQIVTEDKGVIGEAYGHNESYVIKLDVDDISRFRIEQVHRSPQFPPAEDHISIIPINNSAFVVAPNGSVGEPDNLGQGTIISNEKSFYSQDGIFGNIREFSEPNEGYSVWPTNHTGHVGLKFSKDGNIYYGWLYIYVSTDLQMFTIYSYAYESRPGVSIRAGATENTEAATHVSLADVGNNRNASDMQVSFTAAENEEGIDHYRIFVVPAGATFGLAQAQQVEAGRYQERSVTGSNQEFTLSAELLDVNGNAIANGVAYQVYVMSYGENTHSDNLSEASEEITLMSPTLAVSNLTAEEDNGQVRLTFDAASDETGVASYRIFVVPAANAGTFNLETAEGLPSSRYEEVSVDGNDKDVFLRTSLRDSEGEYLAGGENYVVFVMSVGGTGYHNALSDPSASFEKEVGFAEVEAVSTVTGVEEIGRVRVTFTAASDEAGIESYRIFVVPAAEANAFDVERAETISSEMYQEVSPTGGNHNLLLRTAIRDTEGEVLAVGVEYVIFVMSVPEEDYLASLSEGSGEFTMQTVISGNSAIVVNNKDFYVYDKELYINNMPLSGTVKVLNSAGQPLSEYAVSRGDNRINLSGVQDGLLIIMLQGGESVQTIKVIK